jgi:hypothetical protein
MWIGIVPLVLGKLWIVYAVLVQNGNRRWAAAFGRPTVEDPFSPFFPVGLASFLLVSVVLLGPWRGLQRAYRCGWWPAVCIAWTLGIGWGLYALGGFARLP